MIYLGEGQPHRLYKSTVKESLAIIQSLRKYKGNEENNLPLSYMWDIINSGFQEPHPSTTAVDFFMPLFTEACFCIPTRCCCCLPLSQAWLAALPSLCSGHPCPLCSGSSQTQKQNCPWAAGRLQAGEEPQAGCSHGLSGTASLSVG